MTIKAEEALLLVLSIAFIFAPCGVALFFYSKKKIVKFVGIVLTITALALLIKLDSVLDALFRIGIFEHK